MNSYKWAEPIFRILPISALYNYCELITTHVIKQMKNNDKTKQVNFTIAIYICREYLRNKRNFSPLDVINLIEKHVLPVRPGGSIPKFV